MAAVLPDSLSKYWEQFRLTGFPNGTIDGCTARQGIRYILSSAQLLALQTTAVTLVPAPVTTGGIPVPPAGFVFVPTALRAEYVYNSTAYTIANADNAFQIEYVGKTTALLNMTVTGLVDQTASTFAGAATTIGTSKISVANCANLGLEIKLIGTGAALTLGNGTVHLGLDYTIVPLF